MPKEGFARKNLKINHKMMSFLDQDDKDMRKEVYQGKGWAGFQHESERINLLFCPLLPCLWLLWTPGPKDILCPNLPSSHIDTSIHAPFLLSLQSLLQHNFVIFIQQFVVNSAFLAGIVGAVEQIREESRRTK